MKDLKRSLEILNETSAVEIGKAVGQEFGPAVAVGAASSALTKKIAGQSAKVIPGVGTAISWKDAYDRYKEGDRTGAVLAALAGAAFMVPGPGAVAGSALDVYNIGRDIKAGKYDALGQAIKDKVTNEHMENNMTTAEMIALLRNKLDTLNEVGGLARVGGKIATKADDVIDVTPRPPKDMGPADVVQPQALPGPKPVAPKPPAGGGMSNKQKVGAAGLVGLAGLAGLAGGGDDSSAGGATAPAGGAGGGKPPGQAGNPPAAGANELDEFDALARELAQSQDKLAIELMGQYNALRPKLGKAKEVPGELEEMLRLIKY